MDAPADALFTPLRLFDPALPETPPAEPAPRHPQAEPGAPETAREEAPAFPSFAARLAGAPGDPPVPPAAPGDAAADATESTPGALPSLGETEFSFEQPEAEAAWRERFQRYARNLDLDWEEQVWGGAAPDEEGAGDVKPEKEQG